jgi:ArsR family transcriptional regulator
MNRYKGLVAILRALADPTRLRILELLKSKGRSASGVIARDERALCAADIETQTRLSQSAVSHHMSLLVRAELVDAFKRGRFVVYTRNDAAIVAAGDAISRGV